MLMVALNMNSDVLLYSLGGMGGACPIWHFSRIFLQIYFDGSLITLCLLISFLSYKFEIISIVLDSIMCDQKITGKAHQHLKCFSGKSISRSFITKVHTMVFIAVLEKQEKHGLRHAQLGGPHVYHGFHHQPNTKRVR